MLVAMVFSTSQARASERVLDGSFDILTACGAGPGAVCTNPVWAQALGGGASIGPLCKSGTGSCGNFQGPDNVFYLSAPNWVQLGGETSASGPLTYSIEQVVNIPAAPATLSFQLLTKNSTVSTGAFTVRIDGIPVFAAGGSLSSYAPVSVDLSAFASGLRTLRFDAIDTQNSSGSSDSFNIDNVSLDAPDHAAQPSTLLSSKKCRKGKKLKRGRCVKKRKKRR
jgi:hypothetical protein